MAELKIAGKKVVLKDTFMTSEFYDIFKLLTDVDQMDLRTSIPLATRVIESWEFDGNPADPESYGKLDVLRVTIPLFRQIMHYVNRMQSVTEEGEEEDETKN